MPRKTRKRLELEARRTRQPRRRYRKVYYVDDRMVVREVRLYSL